MGRRIDPGERNGVLHPRNLARYSAGWIDPHPAVADVVDQYWHVNWSLDEPIRQKIIASPSVTLTLERGAVPAPFVLTGVYDRAWERTIQGAGEVFAIRLRPAGLAVLTDLVPLAIMNSTLPVTEALDSRSHSLLSTLPNGSPRERADAADSLILEMLGERPISRVGRLANDVVAAIGQDGPSVAELAARFATSERSIQRALRATLGQGPKWVARWLRLQDVVRLLSSDESPTAAAAKLGYSDQAHLINDFRDAVGMTPGAYIASLRTLMG
ncbi:AraC-like DNA-binding protein [Microbacteriaceae bacterium SG_E_30_P1]|uniref:AraC-like DNA-binding protein n=1 Tax=Antiquaquibacter oligotrophicus TaxID=2880260 RepID=A0ABT6KN92_9MICO|nr:AraC family transcriptional regulator [Antiquaquibacter oligotrophicus]MDH6181475.1 AraC-like DNA-binding protein [Antiquaquibacter oligotrophicus]UDF12835.1 AraC family transcriptional regulator [Antiquaquibacter oligotrophicus]